jgi:ABC-type dipeptide/oligopeptide/nickel transport system ATPase subunit
MSTKKFDHVAIMFAKMMPYPRFFDRLVLLEYSSPHARRRAFSFLHFPSYSHAALRCRPHRLLLLPHQGKTTLLNRIAHWEDLDGFPRHLRVLHVKQEMHTENEETTVMDAVLESDVERMTLLQEEKEILARLEGPHHHEEDEDDGGTAATTASTTTSTTSGTATTIEARQRLLMADDDAAKKIGDKKFGDDLKKLRDIYERLTTLGADTAESRATAILTGLQFTEAMQRSPLKSLSGGWRMRTALAAALLIEPDLLMLGMPFAQPVLCFCCVHCHNSMPNNLTFTESAGSCSYSLFVFPLCPPNRNRRTYEPSRSRSSVVSRKYVVFPVNWFVIHLFHRFRVVYAHDIFLP